MCSFDPQQITPAVSLNRVALIDLPGLKIDPEVKGRIGFQLVSATALTKLIQQHSEALQLEPKLDDHALRLALDDCFSHQQARVRAAAAHIGERLGRNLGYLLLTLKRGDPVNRTARDEWDDSYWRYWGRISQVYLGGGLVSGRLGPLIKQHALTVIKAAGVSDYRIDLAPYASALPLVGAARYASPDSQTALVFDFGSTMIKRALATYQETQLAALHQLPARPTNWTDISQTTDDPLKQANLFLAYMVSVISDTWSKAQTIGLVPTSPIIASVAAYIRAGQPLLTQGGAYMQLGQITPNLQLELARQVGARLGQAVEVLLIHDGTAAASAYAGLENTAVITIGTALGIGFPPPAKGLRAMKAGFVVD